MAVFYKNYREIRNFWKQCNMKSEVIMAVNVKIMIFWDGIPCSLNYGSQTIDSSIPKDCNPRVRKVLVTASSEGLRKSNSKYILVQLTRIAQENFYSVKYLDW
jgi:hypothetical protein